MRASIVKVIALKELLESLRDRRTLFLMIFVPILMYPAILILVTQVASVQDAELREKTSKIQVVNGEEHHPLVEFLRQNGELQVELGAAAAVEDYDAIIDLKSWSEAGHPSDDSHRIIVNFRSVEETSRLARDRLNLAFQTWQQEEVARRLESRSLPTTLAKPLDIVVEDASNSAQRGGFLLGSILPFLVVVTVLLGAFYPAIDLTAGEKERGSIQTLFSAPISTMEIVGGKYLAVLTIALISGMANLASMTLMLGTIGLGKLGDLELKLTAPTLAALFITIVVIAFFFASLVLAVAVIARDFKDAQNLLTPVMLLCIIPGTIAQLPGFVLTPSLALIPGVNVILLMKEILVYGVNWQSLFLVVSSSFVTTILALVVASKLFGQEEVIVGNRGSIKLLARPTGVRGQKLPAISEALAWYSVGFILLFYVGTWTQSRDLLWGLLITLWVVLLLPTLGLSRFLKLDLKETFNLRRPSLRAAFAALLLGSSCWILVAALNLWLPENVLPMPKEMAEEMAKLFVEPSSTAGWAWVLFVMAVSPGICEEAMFRGFVFSGLRRGLSPVLLVLVTALMFGAFHMSIYRLFGTTMLGLVMGLLVYRSGSIWTSALFHALNNGLALLFGERIGEQLVGGFPIGVFAGAFGVAAVGFVLIGLEKSPFGKSKLEAPARVLATTAEQ